ALPGVRACRTGLRHLDRHADRRRLLGPGAPTDHAPRPPAAADRHSGDRAEAPHVHKPAVRPRANAHPPLAWRPGGDQPPAGFLPVPGRSTAAGSLGTDPLAPLSWGRPSRRSLLYESPPVPL